MLPSNHRPIHHVLPVELQDSTVSSVRISLFAKLYILTPGYALFPMVTSTAATALSKRWLGRQPALLEHQDLDKRQTFGTDTIYTTSTTTVIV